MFRFDTRRALLGAAFCVSLWFGLLGSGTAHAFEMMTLKSNAARAAVIVLAYDDKWSHYAGEWLFDKYLRRLMRKRYSRLYITRGRAVSPGQIRKAMSAALSTGMDVDFMISTHSNAEAIRLRWDVWVRPEDLIKPVLNAGQHEQLDLAANFGCESEPQWQQFAGLGFRSYLGHEGISVGAIAMRAYLKRWLYGCQTATEAVDGTNRYLKRLFTRSRIARYLYRKLSGERRYKAVLKAFGDDQQICGGADSMLASGLDASLDMELKTGMSNEEIDAAVDRELDAELGRDMNLDLEPKRD